MKKVILVNGIKQLANNQNGQERYSLVQDRATRAILTVPEGKTLASMGVSEGTSIVAIEEQHTDKDGVPYKTFYFMSLFNENTIAAEVNSDFGFQVKLAQTRALAKAGMAPATSLDLSKAKELAEQI